VTEFKVGDLVEFNFGEYWVGGKGKITEVLGDDNYQVEVLILPEKVRGAYYVGYSSDWTGKVLKPIETKLEMVEHPNHYGGDTTYEVIKVAEAWGLHKNAYLFNVLKYIARAEKKGAPLQDKKKARFYLDRDIANDEAVTK